MEERDTIESFGCSGRAAGPQVHKLDDEVSSALRKGQIITKISDVVRELVDNSIDANSSSVQVYLANFGIDKIEVRDTGDGISSVDFRNVILGGFTSKLKNTTHASCGKYYGFRGEALSSICSVSKVSITTKPLLEAKAKKYILSNKCEVEMETIVPYPKGTSIIVEKIFYNFPVRRQWSQDKKRSSTELKEIETYLRSIAIVNPSTHISLYHNSTLLWSKASVPSIEQSLITVLGHVLAKNLVKCGPVNIEIEEKEKRKRTIEAFLLKKPIDLKTMSFTSNKLTMVFINRKRVHVRDFEKLLQQYTIAVVENSTASDARKFPVSVINIRLPSDEVDFNRDTDKSKLFMIHKDEIHKKLEEILIDFYGIDIKDTDANKISNEEENALSGKENMKLQTPRKASKAENLIPTSPLMDLTDCSKQPEKRKENILAFLGNLSNSSENFSQSPGKVSIHFAPSHLPVGTKDNYDDNSSLQFDAQARSKLLEEGRKTFSKNIAVFDVNLDDLDDNSQNEDSSTASAPAIVKDPKVSLKDWVHGRIKDKSGEIIESVSIVNRHPSTSASLASGVNSEIRVNISTPESSFHSINSNMVSNAFARIGSGFNHSSQSETSQPPCKKPRIFEPRNMNSSQNSMCSSISKGISFSTPRQITLDNWQGSCKRTSNPASIFSSPTSPTEIRLESSQVTSRTSTSCSASKNKSSINNPIGIPPKSVMDYWKKACTPEDINRNGNETYRRTPEFQNRLNLDNNMSNIESSHPDENSNTLSSSNIIGHIRGSSFFLGKVENSIGVFSPMKMLQFYPSLKYDLKISLEKISLIEDIDMNSSSSVPTHLQYGIPEDKAPSLFQEFLETVDPESDIFSKIFFKLQEYQQIQSDISNLSMEYRL